MRPPAKPASNGGGFNKGAFYRVCRMLHTYLSAFAFLALILFSATGIALNHPEWFETYQPAESETSVQLTPPELAAALGARDPAEAIAETVGRKTILHGAFASGDREDQRMLIRLDGPKGTSDLDVDLSTGAVDVRLGKASLVATLLDLHRGKNVGAAWRFVIDASAYLIMLLSVIGVVLFFSLRMRLKNSLLLIGASLALMAAVGVLLVS